MISEQQDGFMLRKWFPDVIVLRGQMLVRSLWICEEVRSGREGCEGGEGHV